MFFQRKKSELPTADGALPGRATPMPVPERHLVLGTPMDGEFPASTGRALFGMGCFWGAERAFWEHPGVFTTAVGYSGGFTPNPTYEEVCSGMTGHNEVVLVVFETARTSYEALLRLFWESHDPTQGMRQGNDTGTQYRSGIYVFDDTQKRQAQASKQAFQSALERARKGTITTEIVAAGPFYYAEDYHQQYLARNPGGYCGLGGTGVRCPQGIGEVASA